MRKNIPALRFKDFHGEWEEKIVSAMSEFTYGGGTPSTSCKEFWNGEIPWIQSSDLTEEQVYNVKPNKFITPKGLNKSATKIVPGDSIAIVTRVGVGKLALIPFSYTTSQDFLSLAKLRVEKWFAVYSLYCLIKKELNAVQGTSIKGITKEDLLNKSITLPETATEQTRIGSLFRNLDSLITLEQQKHDKLKNLKKAMLEKMFPKPGATVPEVRFKGFSGEWEEKTLGEILTWSRGSKLAKAVLNQNANGKAVIHYADLYKFAPVVDAVIHWSETEEGTEIPQNSLLFPMSDVTPFGLARTSTILVEGVNAGGDILIGTIEKEHEAVFVSYQINANSRAILPLVTGTTVRHVCASALSTLNITLPVFSAEQTRIGEFFRQLDSLIALQQRKCAKLHTLKKALLGKLFL